MHYKHQRFILFLLSFCLISGLWLPSVQALDRPTDRDIPSEGCLLVGFEGQYFEAKKEDILDRINAIRWEACQEGVLNPCTDQPLTESDYQPLKWSYDLEWIAQIRAAEASICLDHVRPNGEICFTLSHGGNGSYAEDLAWNYSGIMQGIEQWYDEKEAWVEQDSSRETGHYTSMINPEYLSCGLAAFELAEEDVWITTAGEFSYDELDETASGLSGAYTQIIEISEDAVDKISLASKLAIEVGQNAILAADVTVNYQGVVAKTSSGRVRNGLTWSSTNEKVATVNEQGEITALASGTTEIKAMMDNGLSAVCQVTVAQGQTDVTTVFSDVHPDDWFKDAVQYVYDRQLMTGDAGQFRPEDHMTRAMMVTTLYRLAGSPAVTGESASDIFLDVDAKSWYTDAVTWAYQEGITTGYPELQKFGPDDLVTREQLVVFLYRYAQKAGCDVSARTELGGYVGYDQIDEYALEAMSWAVEIGIISGIETSSGAGTVYDLAPLGYATRAQLATILMRFCEYYER